MQIINGMPEAITLDELKVLRQENYKKAIRRLNEGEIFGEIGVLTQMKRTCFVKTNSTCIFQTLTRRSLIDIANKFPSLYQRIYNNMNQYYDEDMLQKK